MLNFIVYFYCHELLLAIEVDGDVHKQPQISTNDLERQDQLESYGVHFLRFDNNEIKQDIDSVIQVIEHWIQYNYLKPSPLEGSTPAGFGAGGWVVEFKNVPTFKNLESLKGIHSR